MWSLKKQWEVEPGLLKIDFLPCGPMPIANTYYTYQYSRYGKGNGMFVN